ncbi:hypothetical protein EVAR_84376_1 [Eumeta japonica]|uniref:Uncharacterized protein n=1 Tax=Eumeta variegata TaxID=151549 RepID=A0A4C1U4N0_EUMVA|nr:hypothetical protein EVAR_84376_1 [Eumeta japonica]
MAMIDILKSNKTILNDKCGQPSKYCLRPPLTSVIGETAVFSAVWTLMVIKTTADSIFRCGYTLFRVAPIRRAPECNRISIISVYRPFSAAKKIRRREVRQGAAGRGGAGRAECVAHTSHFSALQELPKIYDGNIRKVARGMAAEQERRRAKRYTSLGCIAIGHSNLRTDKLQDQNVKDEYIERLKDVLGEIKHYECFELAELRKVTKSVLADEAKKDTAVHGNVTATEYMIDDGNESGITMDEIMKMLKRMKVGKDARYDRVSSEFLRGGAKIVAKLLYYFFNKCWKSYRVPNDWSKAVIIP